MTARQADVSQRLLRKGALVEDTYLLLARWDEAQSLEANLSSLAGQSGRSLAWTREIATTLRRRFRNWNAAAPLVAAAKSGLPLEEWRSCLLLFIAQNEVLYRRFALEWLAAEYCEGRALVRSADVVPYLRGLWSSLHAEGRALTDYGLARTARDLVRMATQLGVLTGDGPARHYRQAILTDRCFLYYLHVLAEDAGGPSRVVEHPLWRTVFMDRSDVEAVLLRLHQYRQVQYHAAGSIVELTLPCVSAAAFAQRMVA